MQDFANFFFIAFGALVAMCSLVPYLLAIVLPILIVFFYLTRFYVRTSRQCKRLAGVSRSPIYQRLGEYMDGLSVIRSCGAESGLYKPYCTSIDKNVITQLMFEGGARWLGIRLDVLNAMTNTVLSVIAFYTAGNVDPALIGVALVQSLQLSGVLQYSIRQAAETESYMTSVERVSAYALLDQEGCVGDTQEPTSEWPQNGSVNVEHLCLRYRSDLDLALDDVSFSVSAGTCLGVVGRTGSGKSTLASAFFRLVEPCAGAICIDGFNILKMDLKVLRKRICVITQQSYLLEGTLRDSLDPFNEHTDDEIWNVIKTCSLERIVRGDAKLNTFVEAQGRNFSAGEIQLLCAARALLQNPRLLIMDEASSSVDEATDQRLQAVVRENFTNCTKIVIAHRLKTIIDADQILVMDGGRVKEIGAPVELLKNDEGAFFALVNSTGDAAELMSRAGLQ